MKSTSILRKSGKCFICGAELPAGTEVEWYRQPVQRVGRFDRQAQAGYANRPIHMGSSAGCQAAAKARDNSKEQSNER